MLRANRDRYIDLIHNMINLKIKINNTFIRIAKKKVKCFIQLSSRVSIAVKKIN